MSTAVSAVGPLLREYRLAAALTQEALAEQAGVGVRSIQHLERGEHRPLKDTVQRLAAALNLPAVDQARLLAALTPSPRRRSGTPVDGNGSTPSARSITAGPNAPDPAGTPPVAEHHLPAALSSFIGREQARVRVRQLLGQARLVTLTGAGGVGKTRLALAVAEELAPGHPNGVCLVELAGLTDPALVPGTVAQVLSVREVPGRHLLATLTEALKTQRVLLVLDNCEHLLDACAALVATLLQACPGLAILATSREGLGVAGEQRYRVPPLSVPDPRHLPATDLVGAYEAVRLFVARAQERQPDFMLTAQNARAVAEVCSRLDGVPLAIELAAARVGSLPVETIAARLEDRFRLLTSGSRTAPRRHQTLRATLEWSWDLLGAPERTLLRRLAVFTGGWTLSAAETVCAGEGLAEWEVLDGLDGLVNRSLVQVDEVAEAARYTMLETVRQFAGEQLAAAGEAAVLRDHHLAWCLALAEEAEPELKGAKQAAWLDRLEVEHDNLRAALSWTRQRGAGEEGLRLAAALWRFWQMRGYLGEGRDWLAGALAGEEGSPAARAKALNAAGNLALDQGNQEAAMQLQQASLVLQRELGDTRGIAASLSALGSVAYQQGGYARAAALHREALALRRELGDRWGIAASLNNLGNVAEEQGDLVQAMTLHQEAVVLLREIGDKRTIAGSLGNQGLVANRQGDYGRAAALLKESLVLLRELGDKPGIAYSLVNLGFVAWAQGEYRQAAALAREGLEISHEIGAGDSLAEGLECLAWVAAAEGQSQRAARLGGVAEALREGRHVPLAPALSAGHDRAVQSVRATLGEDAFVAAWTAGRALQLQAVIAEALEDRAGD